MREKILEIRNLSKIFGPSYAVDHIDLELYQGETVSLLGPSGCGKSTTLRMVAGLERPSSGSIHIRNEPVAWIEKNIYKPPEKRNIGMVFQSYALWPNKTVYENIAYPLQLRRMKRSEIDARVAEKIALVGLGGFEDRPVPLLSGGQQQRVALARALVYEPAILLLDEPFCNLDAKLRMQLRIELRELQRQIDLTCLFVTHDQVEALSVADRVVIMNQGKVEQIDTPVNIYDNSKTRFVRDFLGKIVTLNGVVEGFSNTHEVLVRIDAWDGLPAALLKLLPSNIAGIRVGEKVEVAVRPEELQVRPGLPRADAVNTVAGEVVTLLFCGGSLESKIRVGHGTVLLDLPRGMGFTEGCPVSLEIPSSSASLWLSDPGNREPRREGTGPAGVCRVRSERMVG
jgi:ABC-type Fe3+/spermidine/putrescine transport system ATPase subunit